MHIYEEGGFFDKHKDTQHGDSHIATLLVGLGSKHEGGDLCIEDENGEKTKINLSPTEVEILMT
jgi:hypothetical protein